MDCGPDHKTFIRLNAIHLLLLGTPYPLVVRNSRKSERVVRLWVSRFNRYGVDGLVHKSGAGRPRILSNQIVQEKLITAVDDPNSVGEYHWTAKKIHGWIRKEIHADISYRTVVRYLHEQGYKRKVPRPMPEPSDKELWTEQREDFAFNLLDLLEDRNNQVFFGDEAGFEGDPRPRQRWVKRGSRPTQPYYGGHVRQNIVGAINPEDGEIVSLIVSHNDTEVFQAFLDTMAKEVAPKDKTVWLILDNASWHKSKCLNWHHIKPMFLPPYSPDFNPIERLWQYLKSNYLAGFITKNREELADKLELSIKDLLSKPEVVKSICTIHGE